MEALSIGSYIIKSSSNSFPKLVLEKIIRQNKICFADFSKLLIIDILNDKRNYRK
tara:strand:+ start:2174 stop:2338 length:165 start_codon:yes stop_codon:yes gene_type:complete